MTLGEVIKNRRIKKGFSQQELADAVYSTKTAISQFENDKHIPRIDMLYSIADALEAPIETLMFANSETICDIDISEEFLLSDETKAVIGTNPDQLSLTGTAVKVYENLRIWNPEYTYEKFLSDIIYPYITNHREETMNLIRAYGEKVVPSKINERMDGIMNEDNLKLEPVESGKKDCEHDVALESLSEMQQETQAEAEADKENEEDKLHKGELILSKTIHKDISEHGSNITIIGSARTGESRHMLIPNILNVGTNIVVIDPLGELYKQTHERLEEDGYTVKVFNISDTIYMNDSETEDESHISCIERMANEITAACLLKDTDRIFVDSLHTCVRQAILDAYKASGKIFDNKIFRDVLNNNDGYKKTLSVMPERLRLSCEANIECALYILECFKFEKSSIKDIIENNDKYAVFIVCNGWKNFDNSLEMRMNIPFIDTLIHLCAVDNEHTLFIFDEFGKLNTKINDDGNKSLYINLSDLFVNTKHNSLITVLQTIMQVNRASEALIHSSTDFVIFGVHDDKTAKYISDMLGTVTKEKELRNILWDAYFEIPERPLLTAHEILGLDKEKCIIIRAGKNPVLDKKFMGNPEIDIPHA